MSKIKKKLDKNTISDSELCRFCGVNNKRLTIVSDWNEVGANWIKYLPFQLFNNDGMSNAFCISCKVQLENIGQFFAKIIKVQEQQHEVKLENFKKPIEPLPGVSIRKSADIKQVIKTNYASLLILIIKNVIFLEIHYNQSQ